MPRGSRGWLKRRTAYQGPLIAGATRRFLKLAADGAASRRSGRTDRGRLAGVFQRSQQLAVDVLIAHEDAAGFDHVVASDEIGDETAGLAHQRDPPRHIPGREAAFPIGVDPPGGDPSKIE